MRPSANAVDQSELILSDKSEEVMPNGRDIRPDAQPAVTGGQPSGERVGELRCLRCAHEWFPRKGRTPKCCPFCLSAYWNVPFKRFTSQKDIKAAQAKIRARVTQRQQERARKALRNRLERSARKLGPESVNLIHELFSPKFTAKDLEILKSSIKFDNVMTKPSGMPPPPKFDEDE